MASIIVERKKLSLLERTYLPQVIGGLYITLRNFFKPKITLCYPDERPAIPRNYRGAPTLIKDSFGREKCVSCQLCEFVCPSKAIRITPGAIDSESQYAHIEKAPKEFEIDMLRCIFCGMCQEVCPERAIILQNEYSLTALSRTELVRNKKKLYEVGGTLPDKVMKWSRIKQNAELEGDSH